MYMRLKYVNSGFNSSRS